MTVKTIFKTLIGTIVTMVVSALVIEMFNVNVSGMQIKQMAKMSARQACILFTQETYKSDSGGGVVNMSNVLTNDGDVYINGNFYGSTPSGVWNSIYGPSGTFKNFGTTPAYVNGDTGHPSSMGEQYKELQNFINAINNPTAPITGNYEMAKGQMYRTNKYTASNLGITYIDKEITTRMFKWDLAQILSNCLSDSIQKDEYGTYFVNYKGFRCYVQNARITDCDYYVYDLGTSVGKNTFNIDTGMNADELGLTGRSGDNLKVTVVELKYSLPITYAGITPLKRIFNYTWNHEVKGYAKDGETPSGGSGTKLQWANDKLESAGSANSAIQIMHADDSIGGDGKLPSTGRLLYTLVR